MTASPSEASPGSGNGVAPANTPSFTVTDEQSAGRALNSLLFSDAPPAASDGAGAQSPSPEPTSGDTGAGEPPPTGQDDKGQGEPPAQPAAIEPPTSWSTEDKAHFAALPPEAQAIIARRESQREAALTRSSQEAADARRQFDVERNAAAAQRDDYLQSLQRMMLLAAPEAAQFANIDWVRVQAENPAEYTRLHAAREALKGRLDALGVEWNRRVAEVQQGQQFALGELLTQQTKLLHDTMPDYGDPVKGPTLKRELGEYLRDKGGFTPAEIGNAYDHRLVVLATKAMLYDRGEAARVSAATKINNPAPAVQRPGSAPAADNTRDRAVKGHVERFGRTNSVRDAGSLIAELLR